MKTKISILLVLVLVTGTSYAYGQLYQYEIPSDAIGFAQNRLLFKTNPTFCIHEPEKFNNGHENPILIEWTRDVIAEWEYGLKKHSGNSEAWDIHTIVIKNSTGYGRLTQEFARHCNVNILFDGAPELKMYSDGTRYTKGFVKRYGGDPIYSDLVMFTWDYFPAAMTEQIKIGCPDCTHHFEVKPVTENVFKSTLKHEVGHTIGLNHHKWYGQYSWHNYYDDLHAKRSMMYVSTDKNNDNKTITEFDYLAVMAKYGTDGWGGYTNWELGEFYQFR